MSDGTLRELLRGKRAHADPIACVEDLSSALAGRTIDGYPHSIFQVVEHLNFWMNYEIRRMAGESGTYPEHAIESWPPSGAPEDDEQWRQTIARFGSLLGKLEELADAEQEILNRRVGSNSPTQESESSSVQTVLWQTLVHNSYHIGQVALLRRCLGAWPPRRGGDSW
jgi:hypothetical protein